jgi:hypothetical protein
MGTKQVHFKKNSYDLHHFKSRFLSLNDWIEINYNRHLKVTV